MGKIRQNWPCLAPVDPPPYGRGKYKILTIEIVNDHTGNERIGNYDYRVLVNGSEVASGRIEKFERAGRWDGLIQTLAKQIERDKWLKGVQEFARFIQEHDKLEATKEAQSEKRRPRRPR